MNIFKIVCFVTLSRSSTFHEAADKLYLSQSSFSNNIKSIEHEFGTALVERGTRGFMLTEAGQVFLVYAENISREYGGMKELLAGYKKGSANRIAIYVDPLSSYGYNDMLVNFQHEIPEIETDIIEVSEGNIIDILRANQGAVGIVFSTCDTVLDPDLECRELVRDRLVALVHENHQLAGCNSIHMSNLDDQTLQLVEHRHSAFLYDYVVKQCKKSGFSPDISPYSLWYSTMIETVRELGLTAVISEKAARIFCPMDMRILEITDAEPFHIDAILSSGCTHAAAWRFFDFIAQT